MVFEMDSNASRKLIHKAAEYVRLNYSPVLVKKVDEESISNENTKNLSLHETTW